MNLKKVAGLLFVVVMTCLFWTGYSNFSAVQKIAAKEKQLLADLQDNRYGVYCKLHKTEAGQTIPVSIMVNNHSIMTLTEVAGGITPRERALIVANKLRNFVKDKKDPWKIFPGIKDGIAVIKHFDEVLFTADVKSAQASGITVSQLALTWANNVRKAFGATELINDYELFKLISNNNHKIIGYNELGIASWYGGYFHGRTAADGSTYNMYEYTAAHKSLPFGSIVKVTNLRTGESCVVKITDRGPFVGERIIDLSKVAAEEIGMLDKGISDVKIEVIGKVESFREARRRNRLAMS